MKKTLIASLLSFASIAQAHDLWVDVPAQISSDSILKANIGYGHYPYVEKIPEARLKIFAPMEVISQDGEKQILVQKGENYQYQSSKPLTNGSYWVTATYKPTFWSQNAEGWKMENLKGLPNATYCEGLPLEIVPLEDPSKVKAGEPFPVQIFYNDQPLAGETVIATSDTIAMKDFEAVDGHREPQGFSGKTDEQGRVNIIPLIEGIWKIKVIHKISFPEQQICQQSANYSTLILPIGKGLDKLPPRPEHHHH